MRYWKLKESNRVIAVDILMTPRWLEISKDEFNKIKLYASIEKSLDDNADIWRELAKADKETK